MPTMASPESCCHSDSLVRSYMMRSLRRSLPETPNSRTSPPTLRAKTIAELQSGQYVTITGSPPTTSFTISCHVRMCSG